MSTKQEARVASLKELPVGEVRLLQVNGKSIGLFNTGNQIVAVLNICPHAYAPICRGKLGGTTLPSKAGEFVWGRENEILRCPWHGWEFDLHSGQCLTDRRRLKRFPVRIRDGEIYVEV
ncbi:MAG: Rieske (2Fe-2S) protein [Chloroflexota bacterium]|nr:Rieske (2Fe-2S) protein [Chloroflexota bacterium]MDE2859677.1 Rieske (2Fe-2S) protein [Chloroflexota bacterium]